MALEDPPAVPRRVTAEAQLLRPLLTWTIGLALPAIGVALSWDRELALGIALGALVGGASIRQLAQAISHGLSRAADSPSAPVDTDRRHSLRGLSLAVRGPVVLLVLAGILWYMPARPEGLAAGVAIALLAAVIAASRARHEDSGERPVPSDTSRES